MSRHDVETLLEQCESDTLATRVYRIFIRQPTMIGPNKDQLKPLDLTCKEHQTIYLGAVKEDFVKLLSTIPHTEHASAQRYYTHACAVVLR